MTTRHLTPIIGPTGLPPAAALADYLRWFQQQEWIGDAAAVLYGLGREHQPQPAANRGRPREAIDRLITDKRRPLEVAPRRRTNSPLASPKPIIADQAYPPDTDLASEIVICGW